MVNLPRQMTHTPLELEQRCVIRVLTKALTRYVSRQRICQLKRVAKGLCKRCGKPSVTKLWCRACADEWNVYQRLGSKLERFTSFHG